ncbi:hypothetical protein [Hymenobacter swuensis]|uniref:Lipocalin-like domain-containing protein n=1 Tax=Hymenobacter swuensis DY53 TaxID=1227739 RepID=W8EU51_9BACT|nr:hypothetical protein [Hymenobacter swuensis]AHJ96699.1 hypothetical protein Hsw_1104 [Hymenobacter swuensis DY53]
MRNLFTRTVLFALFLATPAALTSCQDPIDCGCTPPPVEPVTSAALTRIATWWLNEASNAGQTTSTDAIKDRYSMQFKPDGTYTQTMLADGTTYAGAWMLMGTDNRILHLTDHKGAAQEYNVDGVNADKLVYRRAGKNNQSDIFSFGATRK